MLRVLSFASLLLHVHCITKQPTSEPTSLPTRQPTSAPSAKPAYCNGSTVLTGTSGTVNYVVGNYATKTCSWMLSALPGEVLLLNFSRLQVSVDSGYCADCSGSCLRSAQGYVYTCTDVASFCNDSSVVRSVCPQTCVLCDNCQYSYLRGLSGGVEVIHKCGLDTPMPYLVTTSSNNLTLDIVWGYLVNSGYTGAARTDGFTFTWKSIPPPAPFNGTAPCAGVKNLNGPSGGIISDGSEGFYSANSDCLWVIKAPPGGYVNLFFSMFQLKAGTPMGANGFTSCLSDYVRIYDGNFSSGSASILGTFCGTRLPRNLTSSQQMLSVQFISDSAQPSALGFEARYLFTSNPGPGPQYCDGTVQITTPSTIVQSGDYGPSSCRWTITAPPGRYVQIEFVELSVEPSFPACLFDYVEVIDSNLMLMRVCDSISPPVITSFSNSVDIVFFADDYLAGSGFTVVASFVTNPGVHPYMCTKGTVINASATETGIIEDGPVYGRSGDVNTNCSWTLLSPPGTTIKLIYRRFELDPACQSDSITVYDGSNSSAFRLQQVCGTQLPDTITSSSNSLLVLYGADGRVTGSGFSIRYTIVNSPDDLHTARQCDGLKEFNESSSRNISDRSDGSSPRVMCSWRITVPEGKFISLTVNYMNLDEGCIFEFLTVYDGRAPSFPLFDTCGRGLPAPVRSTSNVLQIEYFNEDSKDSPGFEATWEIVNEPGSKEGRVCGGTVYPSVQQLPLNGETAGVISQVGDMTDYRHGMYCGWVIQAPPGQFVRLRFSVFSAPDVNLVGVCHNYLSVLDGLTTRDYELQRSCGSSLPLSVTSSQSALHLQLLNFGSPFLFQAQWDFVSSTPGRTCDGSVDLTGPSGVITDGGQGYVNNANCSFRIQAPEGQLIQLTLANFSLQPPLGGACKDVVRIESNGVVLFEGCSAVPGTTFTSTANSVQVSFSSDKSIAAEGFIINYLFVITPPPTIITPPTPFPSRTPSSPRPSSPTAVEITFEPTTGSPVVGKSVRTKQPSAAPQEEKQDVVGIVIGVLVALVLVGALGGIATHHYCKRKKETAKAMEGLDMRDAVQALDEPAKNPQVQPVDDDAPGGAEITII